jgi:hypothetical protein
VILRFTTGRPSANLLCVNPDQSPYRVSWATQHTESVQLTTPNGSVSGQPNASHQFCGSTGDRVGLVATGPGGETKSSLTLN